MSFKVICLPWASRPHLSNKVLNWTPMYKREESKQPSWRGEGDLEKQSSGLFPSSPGFCTSLSAPLLLASGYLEEYRLINRAFLLKGPHSSWRHLPPGWDRCSDGSKARVGRGLGIPRPFRKHKILPFDNCGWGMSSQSLFTYLQITLCFTSLKC